MAQHCCVVTLPPYFQRHDRGLAPGCTVSTFSRQSFSLTRTFPPLGGGGGGEGVVCEECNRAPLQEQLKVRTVALCRLCWRTRSSDRLFSVCSLTTTREPESHSATCESAAPGPKQRRQRAVGLQFGPFKLHPAIRGSSAHGNRFPLWAFSPALEAFPAVARQRGRNAEVANSAHTHATAPVHCPLSLSTMVGWWWR